MKYPKDYLEEILKLNKNCLYFHKNSTYNKNLDNMNIHMKQMEKDFDHLK